MDDTSEQMRSPAGEKVLGVIGGLLVAAVLGFVAYQALGTRGSAPLLHVEVVAIEDTGAQVVARVRVHNTGGTTAESVHLIATAPAAGTATATLDYVPPHSFRPAALVLAADTPHGVDVRVAGYVPS